MLPCFGILIYHCGIFFLTAYVSVSFIILYIITWEKWVGAVVSYIPWVGVGYKRGQTDLNVRGF